VSPATPLRIRSSEGVALTLHDFGGPAAAPVLVMCHATGFHGRIFEPMARTLTDRYRCVAPDLRGHGTTTVTDQTTFTWDRVADDVLAVVEAVGGGPIRAFGWSLGGSALIAAELRNPGTVAAAFVFEPIIASRAFLADTYDGDNPLAEGARRRNAVFESRDHVLERYRSRPPFATVDPEVLLTYVDHGFADQPDGTVRLRCEPATEAALFEAWRCGLFEHLSGLAPSITVGIGGENTITTTMGVRAAEAIPQATLRVFDDLTHFGPLEAPARIAEAVAEAVG
jgi:pimeloyl-ACP methyl ester carboxylesterase